MTTPYWVRFYDKPSHLNGFEYRGPWWVSGSAGGWNGDADEGQDIIVAAVMAADEEDAKRVIAAAYDDCDGPLGEWSFVNERPAGWEPFCDRFQREKWMRWPWPAPPNESEGPK